MSRVNTLATLFFFFFLIFLGTVVGSQYLLNSQESTQILAQQPRQTDSTQEYVPQESQTETEILTPETIITQISPEGNKILSIKRTNKSDGTATEEFFVTNKDDIKTVLYTQQTTQQAHTQIPFNTWSPNNMYFFVIESTNSTDRYRLFKTSGEPFLENQFIDITAVFEKSELPYKLLDITGWASQAYLVVRTTEIDTNNRGQSYWFDIHSQKFIPVQLEF